MPILQDIKLEINREEVGRALIRLCPRVSPQMEAEIDTAFDMARPLIQPLILYDWVDSIQVDDNRLTLGIEGRRTELDVGEHAGLMQPAQNAYLGVHSIGERLEERVRELNSQGEQLLGYWLDSIGVVALGFIGDVANTIAEKEAAKRDWGVGARLSPGSLSGWRLGDQKKLCGMLPLQQAGLQINGQGVIMPLKSALSLVGMGPAYRHKTVQSVCHLCVHRRDCWRRKY